MENLSLFLNRFWKKVYGQLLALTENFICAEKTPNLQVFIHSKLGVIFCVLAYSFLFCLTKCELNLYFQGVKIIAKRNRVPLSVLKVRDMGSSLCCGGLG